jgi:hypothetical protein
MSGTRPQRRRNDAAFNPSDCLNGNLERQSMTIRLNGALSRCLAGSALGGLIAVSFVPAATAQWLPPPWGAAFPGDIERSLEARGYLLTAPLLRRPGIYLADVSAGPAGYRRLIIDARSGQILESFPASGRMWESALAARDHEFGEPAPAGVGGPPLDGESLGPPGPARAAKPSSGAAAGVHIPAAVSPYGPGAAPGVTRSKTKVASIEHKIPGTKALLINPPLPPPAPREAAKADEPGSSTSVSNVPLAAAPATQGASTEASDKPKVTIVPPAPFE